ncbi:TPA: hypothetical protein ACGF9S_003655, partial [Vibrio cholerae]
SHRHSKAGSAAGHQYRMEQLWASLKLLMVARDSMMNADTKIICSIDIQFVQLSDCLEQTTNDNRLDKTRKIQLTVIVFL